MQHNNLSITRIQSVDFFRGITMFLLAGEASGLYEHLRESDWVLMKGLGQQLDHHEWHGLYFWDLIQPFFMFIVGVSIPFAVANRQKAGESIKTITQHAFKRAGLLLFFGWGLYFVHAGHLVFRFQNVLAQLSVTYLIAFLIRDKSFKFQLGLSLVLLLLIDLAYRYFPVEGFNHPWVPFENMGAWFNNTIEGVEKASIWSSLNVVSTTAHTIWGVLCGKLLMQEKTAQEKIQSLILAGIACLLLGYSLDLLDITPIIKKIATSSFVFASGGWAILVLAFSYWLIDVQHQFTKAAKFFIIVGSNSLFIYLFFNIGGAELLQHILEPFVKLLFSWTGEYSTEILTSCSVWLAMWGICYWLYQKKIFFKF